MHIIDKAMAKYIKLTLLTTISISLLSGCITQSFENNEPIVKNQANRDEMAATRVSLGLGYLNMGDMSQAKLNLEKAKQFSPGLVQVHTAFAHYYETVGEGKLAIESFEQALMIKADSADTLNNYGVFLCRQDNVEAAEVQFLKAIAVPSYLLVSQSYENLSSCYLQINDFDKAEMYLNKAIFHSPNRTNTLLKMVHLQYAMGNLKESKRFLQKFERNTQRFTADYLALAYKLYWKLGQRRTAGNYANMLVKMYPQSWEGKQYLLNELEFIASDELAKKYQLTQKEINRRLSPSKNKRVVKLSPRKSANTPYTSSVTTITPTVKAKDTVVASTAPVLAAVAAESIAVNTPSVTTLAAMPVALVSTAIAAPSIIAASSLPVATANTEVNAPTEITAPSVITTGSTPVVAASEEVIAPTEIAAPSVITTGSAPVVAASAEVIAPAVVTASIPVALATPITAPPVVTATTASAIASEATLASTATAGAVVASIDTVAVSNDSLVNNAEIVTPITVEAENLTSVAIEAAVIAQPASNIIEPTSTQPVPAKRDVPLPEALPVSVEAEVMIEDTLVDKDITIDKANDVTAVTPTIIAESGTEEIIDEVEMVEVQDAFHKVTPGENLYSISVKYNVKLKTLRQWNDIAEKNRIRIGDKLYVVDPQTVKNINE
ncbi:type IV pilus biogenesis/stability protein PilW [Colwellia sp. 75C3]|uniref:type IV pilus biogenesis/stability protein PilW n=1 Tax=Colwellia sp. 75C3 TaxID=888425 RepID=UPI000C327960|nr:type IV pilus biogenesis/stability protein PilW [Colwellia sp. 75C3]PKG83755.1 type IV pilus biogenesis/stability protein PilW [Colwellia sp. 75C3]